MTDPIPPAQPPATDQTPEPGIQEPCELPLQRQEHFRLSFELSPDAISINRLQDGVFVDVNDGFLLMTGYSSCEVLGKTPGQLGIWATPGDREYLVSELRRCGEVKNLDVSYRVKDGSTRSTLTSARQVMLNDVPHALIVARDISALKQTQLALQQAKLELEATNQKLLDANRMLEQLAITDGLTALFNHRYLMRMLELEYARATRYRHGLVLLMLDVDNFKQINDRYGHPCGDEVLRTVARLLKQQSRKTDIIARYGGDEFAIVMMEATQANATRFAEKLRHQIETHTFRCKGALLQLTISVGLAVHPNEAVEDWQTLLRAADGCLYQAKRAGRNRVAAQGLGVVPPSGAAAQLSLFSEPRS